MGLIKEPLNVDFYFDGKQMTDEDQKRVSEYIIQQQGKIKVKPKPRDAGKRVNMQRQNLLFNSNKL